MRIILALLALLFSMPATSAVNYSTYACASPCSTRPTSAALSTGTASQLSYNWGSGAVLGSSRSDWVAAKFTGYIYWPGTAGQQRTLTFNINADDAHYFTINGAVVSNDWGGARWNSVTTVSATLTAGQWYSFEFWYLEKTGNTNLQLKWNATGTSALVEAANFTDVLDVTTTGTSTGITVAQQSRVTAARTRVASVAGNSIYIEQTSGSGNSVTIEQNGYNNKVAGLNGTQRATMSGNTNTVNIKQGDAGAPGAQNLVELNLSGNSNSVTLSQGIDTASLAADGAESGGHVISVNITGSSNTATVRQSNDGGANSGHYAELAVTGSSNANTITQSNNSDKKLFASENGSNNTVVASQTGTGNHYADIILTGNGHAVNITQRDSGTHTATIDLTNSGGASTVNLTQQGATNQSYSIQQQCATLAGCSVTVTQGQ